MMKTPGLTLLAAGALMAGTVQAQTYTRTETIAYHDDTTKWVIGQVASVTDIATEKEISQTEFNSAALPERVYGFGHLLLQTASYNADGTLASVTDGNGNTTSFSSWYRGIPRRIDYPTDNWETAAVNPLGWITSTTDELGSSTGYGYDTMGRLSSVTYPAGDTTVWNPLARGFVPVATAEYGIAAGHWKQTVSTGNGQTTTYYNALWQPLLVVSEDTGNTASKSLVVTRYDATGRAVFTSYPVASLTSVNDTLNGVTTVYDALGRVTQTRQDSELGVLTTTTEYLTGFQTRVTNSRGFQTTTSYQTFDQPDTSRPVKIEAPQGVTTTIVRDGFGKPLSITRSGTGG